MLISLLQKTKTASHCPKSVQKAQTFVDKSLNKTEKSLVRKLVCGKIISSGIEVYMALDKVLSAIVLIN